MERRKILRLYGIRLYGIENQIISGHNQRIWHQSYGDLKSASKNGQPKITSVLNGNHDFTTGLSGMKRNNITSEIIFRGILSNGMKMQRIQISIHKPFITFANRILAITKDDDYLQNQAKQAQVLEYEKQIDQMVYEPYGLTGEEINIVKGGYENAR